VVSFGYDNNFWKVSEVVSGASGSQAATFGYDADGLVVCVSPTTCPGSGALSFERHAGNGVITSATSGLLTETHSATAYGELARHVVADGTTTLYDLTLDSTLFPRDPLGRIVRKTEVVLGTTRASDYTYDVLGRLTEFRNPGIAMALRRIAMCEQAGTGLRMMQGEWQTLGRSAPSDDNDGAHKSFKTFLPQPWEAMGLEATGHATPEVTGEVTGEVARLLGVMNGELSRLEIQGVLGLKHEDHFREAYLTPAQALGLIEMTVPGQPKSRLQRCRLTELGERVKRARPA